MSVDIQNRVRGCLLGVAIGDALGAPFENLRPGMPDRRLAATGGRIEGFHPYGSYPPGTWTDDTGMTLAVCRAFVEHLNTGKDLERCFREAFYAWVTSPDSRGAGHTVNAASRYGKADENSWANGALMRTAPVGVYAYLLGYDDLRAADLAMFVARLTHGHPLATLPTVECVLALLAIFKGEARVPERLSRPWEFLSGSYREDHRIGEYKRLRNLPTNHADPTTGLWMWKRVFEDVLGLKEGVSWDQMPGFEEGILKAVNECVDRDTAGAVAGSLLGAYWGYEKIPEKWKEKVYEGEGILFLANELILPK